MVSSARHSSCYAHTRVRAAATPIVTATTAARELRLELPLLQALLLGRRMSGDLPRLTRPRMSGDLPPAYAPGPAVAAAAPYGAPGYGYGPGPYPDTVIVNPVTGRWCRTESNGYQWCWTP
jgi:hypothetical protein